MKTAQGRALVERHRVSQVRLAMLSTSQLLRLWPLLFTGPGTFEARQTRWLALALATIETQRRQSAAVAATFAAQYRVAEVGSPDGFVPVPVLTFNREQVTTSLMVTGPTAYRRQVAKQLGVEPAALTPQDLAEARLPQGVQQKIGANQARAGTRHVLNGGRETLDDAITRDRRATGWFRVTDGDPCWFCAMLASRGPVYEQDSMAESDPRFSGPGDQKVHDSCGCMLVPMYARMTTDEEKAQLRGFKELDALWQDTKSREKFREAYEARKTN